MSVSVSKKPIKMHRFSDFSYLCNPGKGARLSATRGGYPGKKHDVDHVKRDMFVGGAQYWAWISKWGGEPTCTRSPDVLPQMSMACGPLPLCLRLEGPRNRSTRVQRGGVAPICWASLEPTRTPAARSDDLALHQLFSFSPEEFRGKGGGGGGRGW